MARKSEVYREAFKAGKSPEEFILDALNENPTQTLAAESLGVSITAIRNWMQELGIKSVYVLDETKNAQESA